MPDLSIVNAVLPPGPWSPYPSTRLVRIDIEDGRISGVRDDHETTAPAVEAAAANAPAPAAASVLDVQGSCVLPGFIDTHTHLGWAAEDFWSVSWTDVLTRAAALARLEVTTRRVDDGFWMLGGDWLPGKLPDRELPTLAELDALTGAKPLLLVSRDHSRAVLNSRALRLSRIDRTTSDPAGGQICRDRGGEPTGLLYGEAVWGRLAVGVVPPRNQHRQRAEMHSLLADLTRRGVTEVHDIGTYPRTGSIALINSERSFTDVTLLEEFAERGELPLRIGYRPSVLRVADFAAIASRPSVRDALVSFAGFKMSLDNGWFSEPAGPRVDSFRYPGPAAARDLFRQADGLGAAVSIHAIGDLGVAEALDLIGSLRNRRDTSLPPHRIIHARRIRAEDVPRLASLGIIVEAQPWEIVGAGRILARGRSDEFAALLSPYRTLLDAGVTVAFGSDRRLGMRADLADCDPLTGVQIAATRMDPTRPGAKRIFQDAQRLTVTEALYCATGAGAAAIGAAAHRGRVAAGCDADLVILSADPTASDPHEINKLRVELTVSAGRLLRPGSAS